MARAIPAALVLLLAACSPAPEETEIIVPADEPAVPAPAPSQPIGAGGWELVSSGEGDGLSYTGPDGERQMHLFCPSSEATLLVNVPGFEPIGSEERMTFGANGEVTTLVADTAGDPLRGGVTGTGPVPDILTAILSRPEGISANYGAQNIGPFAPIPAEAARQFESGCRD